jgi:creatinine amidohydrolase/Fe(II)-dependent formamide hydrolase-like protein
LMLAIDPSLVDLNATDDINMAQLPSWASGDLLHGPRARYYRSFRQLSSNGVLGAPQYASATKGEQITSVVVRELRALLDDMQELR